MSRGIHDQVAIVGVGCCQFGENWDQSPSDMIVDAAYEAYADAGIDAPQERIEAVFTGSLYSQKGPHECSDALKMFHKPVSMVSNYCATGTDAFRYGAMSVAAGMYDVVLVVGYDKPKDRGVSGPSVMMDGVRDLPKTPAGWFALCAATYFEKYGASRDDLAKIAIKNHHNGTLAPKSFLKREITLEDYQKARIISWPFGLYDSAAQPVGFQDRKSLVGSFWGFGPDWIDTAFTSTGSSRNCFAASMFAGLSSLGEESMEMMDSMMVSTVCTGLHRSLACS